MSKVHLENCYLCGESKAAIKYSQSIKDPIYCVLMGTATEGGPAEAYQEFDHHVFVVTEEQIKADKDAEMEWFATNGITQDDLDEMEGMFV